jgi:hypothetical protein
MKHHSGMEYVKAAQKNGLPIEMGKGDHCKIFAPAGRGLMVVPLQKELSNGVECKVAKWFKSLGIVLTVIGVIVYIVSTI